MSTGLARRQRLAEERKSLHDNFDEDRVRWLDSTTAEPKVEVEMVSKRRKKDYIFRVYIPKDFPKSCPKLAVVWPERLLHRNGSPLPVNCAEYSNLELHDGFYTIRHFQEADWRVDIPLYHIFTKAALWMEAYESHLSNGKNVDYYLRQYQQPVGESSNDTTTGFGSAWYTTLQFELRFERRLTEEKQVLDDFYPACTWRKSSTGHTTVDVEITTENENVYKLRVYLPYDYPNSIPTLAVVSPENLRREDGRPLPEKSKEFRTNAKTSDGQITICHYLNWTDSIPLSKVFTKGELWVKAYDSYLAKKGDFQTCLNEQLQSSD